MFPFTFQAAADEDAASRAVRATPGARFLAGGTTLVDLMKLNVERPSVVVDINALPLTAIEELPDGGVRVGAMVRNSDMANHPAIRSRYPFLSQALLAGASPQLRNMATTGGNLMQRTRCYYFRDTAMPCNKREPGSGCAALDGHNRIHAILGTSAQCIAAHASDMCVPLTALDAVIHVNGERGPRTIPIGEFYLLPGDRPEVETALEPGELITAVDLPPLPFVTRSVYVKVRDRASYAFALASAAVALDLGDGRIRNARIALGGVGTRPWRAHAAERTLAGARPGAAAYQAAAAAALEGAAPRTHNAFKIELAKRTLMRALARAEALA
ncbi:MAG TPA: xanthine dehydrogenase family protein subunit M [Vicinamibacterales bacterium]|jgi:xanthine dehydrogenase YagS FAD-binding subunit|nr:xanthine dehydrogenase family protein subunit M [Vicinamibacterales bacterium]